MRDKKNETIPIKDNRVPFKILEFYLFFIGFILSWYNVSLLFTGRGLNDIILWTTAGLLIIMFSAWLLRRIKGIETNKVVTCKLV